MKPMIYYRIKEYIFHIGAKWDKKAVKEENAIDFAHEHINAEPKQCMNSLEYLLANAGENINKQLRKACISNQKYMPFIIPISITFCILYIYQETENFRKSLDFSHAEGK